MSLFADIRAYATTRISLSNPKLIPKLTEAAPPELQKKEGVADQQLAKLEAERARKRGLERDDDGQETTQGPSHRRRSASYDSVSTISTTRSLSRSPPRPSGSARRRASRSPSPMHQQQRRPSYGSASEHGSRRSRSPLTRHKGKSPQRLYGRETESPEQVASYADEYGSKIHGIDAYSTRHVHRSRGAAIAPELPTCGAPTTILENGMDNKARSEGVRIVLRRGRGANEV
ncbi:putative Zinc knuckle-domain-containing protein [Seiridium unicorne]|uniref:Zinc knuckle-domain-containing protein n=1 Tax=Seiridium unicorne TaxID=138068 RepID=A0ABR2UZN2_9PEZI